MYGLLISSEKVTSINFFFDIIQAWVVAISENAATFFLELFKIIYYFWAKECWTNFQCWLIDNNGSSLGFDSFHHSLDAALSKVVRITLHSQPVHTDDAFFFILLFIIVLHVSQQTRMLTKYMPPWKSWNVSADAVRMIRNMKPSI